MPSSPTLCLLLLFFSNPLPHTAVLAQGPVQPVLEPQTDTWNSTSTLSHAQISTANISDTTAGNINVALQFERTNWATGSVVDDAFYTDLPSNISSRRPGTLLKAESVNASLYTLPPKTALTRITYTTEDANGNIIPASGYVLWPYLPRPYTPPSPSPAKKSNEQKIPLVAFGHGFAGTTPECAPSHIRNLWYAYSAPFTLTLAGYAVVAPDYAGLGVSHASNGEEVPHQLFSFEAHASDVVYAVEAAKQIPIPQGGIGLSDDWVVVGHSQGGGAAWGVAEREERPKGYLGAVIGSPLTNGTRLIEIAGKVLGGLEMVSFARGVVSSLAGRVSVDDILTEHGKGVLELMEGIGGCSSVMAEVDAGLVADAASDPGKLAVAKEGFWESESWKIWTRRSAAGGRKMKGPVLVMHGVNDMTVPEILTQEVVNETCKAFPKNEIEYVRFPGVGHISVMYAAQTMWLDWIADRFAGRNVTAKPCTYRTLAEGNIVRLLDEYNGDLSYFLEYATQPYQTA
jgi:pimeloyl-ACP methyl ester carboxylesterase